MSRWSSPRKPLPTRERVLELLAYDPETGEFTWKMRSGRQAAGKRAGCLSLATGYVVISVDGTLMTAHRLAWFIVHGCWPEDDLDHRDLDQANNRIRNLRPATRGQNIANANPSRANTSGFKGVTWDPVNLKWIAQIKVDGKYMKLGRFIAIEDAAAAYRAAAVAAWGDYARS